MRDKFKTVLLDYLLLFKTIISSNLRNRSLILCHHCFKGTLTPGVYVDEDNCIDADLFEQQVRLASKYFEFVPLETIIKKRNATSIPRKGRIAITFDDGYRSVKEKGAPIFKRYQIPATIFIATKFVEEPRYLPWWDLVPYVAENYPGILEMDIFRRHFLFDLDDPKRRRTFKESMAALFREASPGERNVAQSILEDEVAKKIALPQNGLMTLKELKEIASLPHVTLGAHTHSHVNVAKCATEELQSELQENKAKLSAWTGRDVNLLAYPYGKWRHVGPRAEDVVRNLGFKAAFMTEPAYIDEGINRYRLPRLAVDPSWTMLRFRTRIFNLTLLSSLRRGC